MSEKPRVCLIYTGGTIGMTRSASGTLKPPEDPKDFLKVAPELQKIVDLSFVGLMNKDSTNVHHGDWSIMAKEVYKKRNEGFDGFVIAHGTDTMHFSASALAFALGENLNFPVVFTGAQTIPDVLHGDAKINLIRACKVATTKLAEVVISFSEHVFRGCRAQKKDEKKFDAFESPAYFPVAHITEQIVLTPQATNRKKPKSEIGDIDLKSDFADGVVQVSLIPGLEPELLVPVVDDARCKGLILQSYGAGNVPHEEPYSFSKLIKLAQEKQKPILITSQFPANETLHSTYEPGLAAIEAGAIPTGNMTASCAGAKFRWVIAQVEKMIEKRELRQNEKIMKIRKMMDKVYVGEMGDPISNGR